VLSFELAKAISSNLSLGNMNSNFALRGLKEMVRGIIIFGSPGSGKTTLGKLAAKKLDFPYFDIDDYIWRKDTDKPFTVMHEGHCRFIDNSARYDTDGSPCMSTHA